jgi:uncharacterized hydrophobic protein (TIGR00271 family)
MAMMHLRVFSPADTTAAVLSLLDAEPGAANVACVAAAGRAPAGDVVLADLARESVPNVLDRLHALGVAEHGTISLEVVDTAIGAAVVRAEKDAPGQGADAVIWDEVVNRTGEDSTLTWSFLAFIVLATVLAAVGVVTDSPVTIVGAMVLGPEFGPLAGLAVGLLRRRPVVVRRAALALGVGFAAGLAAAALATLLWRAVGLVHASDLAGHRQTEFIYHPGWFSFVTALLAGAAGTLSLTSNRSAALIGVFISVTTVPAAGYAAVAAVLGDYHGALGSAGQLAINLVGIVAAAYAVLLAQAQATRRRRARL